MAKIMDISPWGSPYSLFVEKVFGKEQEKTFAMQRGSRLEAEAREILCDKHNLQYIPICVERLDFPHHAASLDGYCLSKDWGGATNNFRVGCEIKVPMKCPDYEKIGLEIPDYYYVQLQWQIYVADLDQHFYCVYDPQDKDMHTIEVDRDNLMIGMMIQSADAFKARMTSFDPPEPTDKDQVEIHDCRAKELASRSCQIADQIRDLERDLEYCRKELRTYLKHDVCRLGDVVARTVHRVGSVEYARIPELSGVDLNSYRKDSTSYLTIRRRDNGKG